MTIKDSFFRPMRFANNALYVSAINPSNGNLPVNNSAISTFADLSGNSNSFDQATGARQPLFIENQLNGRPIIRFDGTDDRMQSNLNINYTVVPDVTIFLLYKLNSGGGTNQAFFGQDNGSFDRFALGAHSTLGPGVSTGSAVFAVAGMATTNTWQLLTVQWRNGVASGSQVWLDGVSQGTFTESHNNNGDSTLTLGAIGTSGSAPSKIDVAAMVIYTSFFSSASDRQQIEKFINVRFGRA